MHLSFIVPLTSVVIAGYIYKKSAEEMAYLAASILVVSLFVTLVLAPWQLQLLLLLGVLLPNKQPLQVPESQEVLYQKTKDNKLKLIYRGSTYEYTSQKAEKAAPKTAAINWRYQIQTQQVSDRLNSENRKTAQIDRQSESKELMVVPSRKMSLWQRPFVNH